MEIVLILLCLFGLLVGTGMFELIEIIFNLLQALFHKFMNLHLKI